MKNKTIDFVKRPQALPDLSTFEIREIPMPTLRGGQALIETAYISVDPYMRGRMREGKSYIEPFALGQPMVGGVVGRIVESDDPGFKKGDYVLGNLPWQLYIATDVKDLLKVDTKLAPPSTALGVLGMPGLTAYFGLLDIGKPKPGETVVVSGAAGAVGSTVGQIAKLKGARVVGIAGSVEKIRYLMDELGFDAAVNYKETGLFRHIKDACPDGVDVYFDNVGGVTTEVVLPLLNKYARIPICGQIAMYNQENPDIGLKPQMFLLAHSALMQGFIVFNYQSRYPEALKQLTEWVATGKIRYRENVIEGFENTPKALIGLFYGENIGKQIVKVAAD